MKKFLLMLMLVANVVHAEVTHQDVETALHTVTTKTFYLDDYRITKIGMEDPFGAIWNHRRDICEIVVSAKNVNSVSLMFGFQPKMPMLEGFIAHELSHCVELKELAEIGGYSEMQKLLQNSDNRFASELLADIVAIMYWKQFYKNDSVWYIAALLKWRWMAHGDDVLHATFPSLQQALPLIPARVDYQRAVEIRDIVLPR